MQTHGGEAAEAAITSQERHIYAEVLVDWNRNGRYDHALSDLSEWVESATTDRGLHGSAPEELFLIEGASAAELTVTLGGDNWDGQNFVSIFSPYNGDSPFYGTDIVGSEIRYSIGVGTALGIVWYPQFVGNIRTISPDRATGSVEITALDRVEVLRSPVSLPPWGVHERDVVQGKVLGQLQLSSGIIDNCLRHCDVSPTPFRPTTREEMNVPDDTKDGTHFWLTGTGGQVPVIGWVADPRESVYPHTEVSGQWLWQEGGSQHPSVEGEQPAPLALAGVGGATGQDLVYWVDDRDLVRSDGAHYIGFTLVTRGTNGNLWKTLQDTLILEVRIGDRRVLRFFVDQGEIYSEYQNELIENKYFYTPRIPIPDGRDYIPVYTIWHNSSHSSIDGLYAYINVGGNDNGGQQKVGDKFTGERSLDPMKGRILVRHRVPLNDIFYGTRNILNPGTNVVGGGRSNAKYAAVLDKGNNLLSYTPKREGVDAWDIITEVAAAEFGSVFWDEEGVFRFWNYDRIKNLQSTIVRNLSIDDVSGLSITDSLDSVRNIWSVELNQSRSRSGVKVYESGSVDQFYVPSRTRRIFRVYRDRVQIPDPGFLPRYTTNTDMINKGWWKRWTDDVTHGYCLQYFYQGQWRENTQHVNFDIDLTIYYDRNGHLVINIWNPWAEDIRLATADNRPALRIRGTEIHSDEGTIVIEDRDEASIRRHGAKNYKISSDWYGEFFDRDTGGVRLIDKLLARTARSVPTTDAVTIAGDPRLQLGDCFSVSDPDGFGEEMRLQIYGIRRTFDRDSGLSDTLTVELLRPPEVGIWDSPQYGRWDETFVWSD